MAGPPRLHPGIFYHLWNRGVDRGLIFRQEDDYRRFMQGFELFVSPVALVYAYCLIPNHFHFLIRTRTEEEQARYHAEHVDDPQEEPFSFQEPSTAMGNFLNSYVKASNYRWGRTGGLFEGRFGRNPVDSDEYLRRLILYIHHNPQKHNLVDDFRLWPYSSYGLLFTENPTIMQRDEVLKWFGGPRRLAQVHEEIANQGEWEEPFTTLEIVSST